MRRFVGPVLMAVGSLHLVYVTVASRGPLAAIGRAGVFDAVGPYLDREMAFWSLWFGVLLITLGYMIHWIARQGQSVPSFPGWVLLGMGAIGGLLMPASPFWVAIPLGLLLLVPDQRGAATASQPLPAHDL